MSTREILDAYPDLDRDDIQENSIFAADTSASSRSGSFTYPNPKWIRVACQPSASVICVGKRRTADRREPRLQQPITPRQWMHAIGEFRYLRLVVGACCRRRAPIRDLPLNVTSSCACNPRCCGGSVRTMLRHPFVLSAMVVIAPGSGTVAIWMPGADEARHHEARRFWLGAARFDGV